MFGFNKPVPDCSAEFDIEGLNVYSVERQKLFDGWNTTISWWTDKGEWLNSSIVTTDAQHCSFVKRLTDKLLRSQESANNEK